GSRSHWSGVAHRPTILRVCAGIEYGGPDRHVSAELPKNRHRKEERSMKSRSASPFLVLGFAFIAFGLSGQRLFICVALVFLPIGLAFLRRQTPVERPN